MSHVLMVTDYEEPPPWIDPNSRKENPIYDNRLTRFLPRLLHLKKSSSDESLGFNIRGGVLYFSNIFVSKIYPDTLAFRHGVHEGDQLVSVNGIDFRIINHFEAVKIFKECTEFLIVLKYSPYDYKKSMQPISKKEYNNRFK